MKTPNTPENKAKFLANYWGQQVLGARENEGPTFHVSESKRLRSKVWYAKLKPLSSISDKDAIAINCDSRDDFLHYGVIAESLKSYEADYLRSKGYAVPWMDLSVDDLVEYGWVKIVE